MRCACATRCHILDRRKFCLPYEAHAASIAHAAFFDIICYQLMVIDNEITLVVICCLALLNQSMLLHKVFCLSLPCLRIECVSDCCLFSCMPILLRLYQCSKINHQTMLSRCIRLLMTWRSTWAKQYATPLTAQGSL